MARKDDADATPDAPDPWAILDKIGNALEALKGRPQDDRTTQMQEALVQGLARLAEANIEGSKIVATEQKRGTRPSNEVVPQVSLFNRRGVTLTEAQRAEAPQGFTSPVKPPLKCEMFIPFVCEWESCNREEVQLLNLLEQGEYVLSLVDRSKVKLAVKIEAKLNGQPGRLLMYHIAPDGSRGTLFSDKSTSRLVPPLADWLRQLLKQHDPEIRKQAAMVLTDEMEEALIEVGELSYAR